MGNLPSFSITNISNLKEQFQLTHFVETGAYLGDSLFSVLSLNFKEYYSVDINPHFYQSCCERFLSHKNIHLVNDNSFNFLRDIKVLIENEETFFFLDAHYPDKESDERTTFPLVEELTIIKDYNQFKNSVILIDDLRIYENGNFDGGNLEPQYKRPHTHLDFDFFFSETHNIVRYYHNQGYLLATPKT